MTPLLTIRSTPARVGAWAWMAFAALNLIDIALRGRDTASAVMAALLLLGCGIAYVLGLRPAVVADEGGFTVRNPLRDVRVPWRAAKKVEATDALTFRFRAADGEERKVKAWVLTTSPRAQARAERRAARDARDARLPQQHAARLKGRTPVTYAAQRLNEIADRQRPKGGTLTETGEGGVINWSVSAVAALAVPAALVIAAAVPAVLA
ncbi:hypothetical protein Acsp03_14550 [Actinomadura sp. NBRC 104412]|uniref:PH domain-containing protein n=1 Tax=Actinomadura sp. NBRC 104412 TaxID=3032203 RepID=UPI0024A1621C|nr:PH domain-containing protein [Actinomadura sp. NBRC 104412]GLZ03989.1 hypothetical protein Acsp03_14550 [Actinomadura sp. NBRC 104412]